MTTARLLLVLPAATSLVLPLQYPQLDLYDGSPIVKFPARHEGRVINEKFVNPVKVFYLFRFLFSFLMDCGYGLENVSE